MYDSGSTAFMLVCTMLVLLMTPGLAFFYGGLTRRKNVLNTMIMVFVVIGVVGVSWVVAGWSFAYGGDGTLAFFGGFDQIGCMNVMRDLLTETEAADGAVYPSIINIAFQMAFAMITTAIITGAVAGRMKFGAMVAFMVPWVLVVYAPLAHMVWGGEGSLIGEMIGALDFAGGDVVHISSGLTGLILCIMMGRRKGFGMMSYRPHNVPFVALGATLLWFGWFGFNAGSEFAADGIAALALLNTVVASASGLLCWMLVERIVAGKATLVGAATGLVAGLVAITPAAGFVEPWSAIAMGFLVTPCCYFAISFCKRKFGYDDALDAFGCHTVGGIVGGILTGVFCVPELSWTDFGGLLYTGDFSLLGSQIAGIVVTIAFVIILDVVIGLIVTACFKGSLRVSDADEAQGLDVATHGESAYPAFVGLD
ncbi:ammonium transporter [Adlercreutzia agrestimuris]|uniref:ammonium transporter n=1 Tax=Adlercreutzia agrestimuris TaxID=2941324 RepID=UPI002040FDC0|nr:ammonium transporter [Adlercreutzia agrestimuris]